MQTTQELDFMEFQKILTPNRLRAFKIIHSALLLGVGLSLGILFLIAYSNSSAKEATPAKSLTLNLTIIHIVIASLCYLISATLFRYMTGPNRFPKNNPFAVASPDQQSLTPEVRYLAVIFNAYIVRTIIFEGIAFFGIIICLLGASEGYIRQHPIYWLNLFSFVIMAGMMIYTFPTRAKLEDLFKKRCIVKPPHVC